MTKYQRRVKNEKKEFKDKVSDFKAALEVHLSRYHQMYKNNFKGYKLTWDGKDPPENRSLKDFKAFVRRLRQRNSLERLISKKSATNRWISIPILNGTITFWDTPDVIAKIYLNLPYAGR